LPAALLVVLALVVAPGAAAQTPDPPCPAGTPSPVFTVNGKTAPVYTTNELTVRVRQPGDSSAYPLSFEISGARLMPSDDEGDSNTLHAIADVPGTLTASAVMTTYPDQGSGESCTVSGSATFEIKQATVPVVTLRRPRPLLSDPPLLWDSEWRLVVALGPTVDRSPLTVEARAIRRAKLPGKGAKRRTRTIALRASDQVEDDESDQGQLISSPRVNSWPKGAQVDVFSKTARTLIVQTTLPSGYPSGPRGLTRAKSPVGVDVRILQSGRAIGRLRLAGRCEGRGQFYLCRFKTFTTKLK
jgi:hypothetical protein